MDNRLPHNLFQLEAWRCLSGSDAMWLDQFTVTAAGQLHSQGRRHGVWAAAAKVLARWRCSSYAPLVVVLLVWALLFLLALALVVSLERW